MTLEYRLPSAARRRRVALERARLDDLDDLLHREADLVVRREEVRAEADSRAWPEVAEDPAQLELGVHGRALRDVRS